MANSISRLTNFVQHWKMHTRRTSALRHMHIVSLSWVAASSSDAIDHRTWDATNVNDTVDTHSMLMHAEKKNQICILICQSSRWLQKILSINHQHHDDSMPSDISSSHHQHNWHWTFFSVLLPTIRVKNELRPPLTMDMRQLTQFTKISQSVTTFAIDIGTETQHDMSLISTLRSIELATIYWLSNIVAVCETHNTATNSGRLVRSLMQSAALPGWLEHIRASSRVKVRRNQRWWCEGLLFSPLCAVNF